MGIKPEEIKTSKGNYLNLFEHLSPILLDENSQPIMGVTTASVVENGEEQPIVEAIKLLNKNNKYKTLFVKNYSQKLLTDGLSLRERDMLRLLVLNKTSKEIGESLFISFNTVNSHRRNIIKKLGVNSTA